MVNGDIQLVVNTASGGRAHRDGVAIRRGALELGIPYSATVPGALAVAEAIAALRRRKLSVRPLQEWAGRQRHDGDGALAEKKAMGNGR
jgi:carbamoyl-phosphate synthase large subunit